MEVISTPKPFSVDVFSDQNNIDGSPWLRIGEFETKGDAIEACKKVVEDFLSRYGSQSENADTLIFNYLNYGPVPCINGTENLTTFELYEYLNRRCLELGWQ
ncbi:hypothetical protein [Polynucleobacter sp. MWH-Tro8-2-5-gr]|uniref:hypothetical protein n=1 Tax=Polynucleobacter sp. MWH-Tro8-2-5-gr TaxID=1855606 RepID=UPI0011607A8F|nr:hypothetical protein [Polynucleobacter sp. MWH-Tro8-2-5-gr]